MSYTTTSNPSTNPFSSSEVPFGFAYFDSTGTLHSAGTTWSRLLQHETNVIKDQVVADSQNNYASSTLSGYLSPLSIPTQVEQTKIEKNRFDTTTMQQYPNISNEYYKINNNLWGTALDQALSNLDDLTSQEVLSTPPASYKPSLFIISDGNSVNPKTGKLDTSTNVYIYVPAGAAIVGYQTTCSGGFCTSVPIYAPINQQYISATITAIKQYEQAIKEGVLEADMQTSYNIYNMAPTSPVPLSSILKTDSSGNTIIDTTNASVNYTLEYYYNPLFGNVPISELDGVGGSSGGSSGGTSEGSGTTGGSVTSDQNTFWDQWTTGTDPLTNQPNETMGISEYGIDTYHLGITGAYRTFVNSLTATNTEYTKISSVQNATTNGVAPYHSALNDYTATPLNYVDNLFYLAAPSQFDQNDSNYNFSLDNTNGFTLLPYQGGNIKLQITNNEVDSYSGSTATKLGSFSDYNLKPSELLLAPAEVPSATINIGAAAVAPTSSPSGVGSTSTGTSTSTPTTTTTQTTQNSQTTTQTTAPVTNPTTPTTQNSTPTTQTIGVVVPLQYAEVMQVFTDNAPKNSISDSTQPTGRVVTISPNALSALPFNTTNPNVLSISDQTDSNLGVLAQYYAFAAGTDPTLKTSQISVPSTASSFVLNTAFENTSTMKGVAMYLNDAFASNTQLLAWLKTSTAQNEAGIQALQLYDYITGEGALSNLGNSPLTYTQWQEMQNVKQQLANDANNKLNVAYDTFMLISGIGLILYAVVFMLAFWFDLVNPFFESSILRIITGGRLYPVSSREELADYGDNSKYITPTGMFVTCAALIISGVTFMNLQQLIGFFVWIYNLLISWTGI
jgi:hypothetical protein